MCCQLVIGTSKTTTVGTGRDLSVTRQLPTGGTYRTGNDLSLLIKNIFNVYLKTFHYNRFYDAAISFKFKDITFFFTFFLQNILLQNAQIGVNNPIFLNAVCLVIFEFDTSISLGGGVG